MAVAKAKEALLDNSSKLMGAIINNLSAKTSSYYYYSSYKYKYRHGQENKASISDKEEKRETEKAII